MGIASLVFDIVVWRMLPDRSGGGDSGRHFATAKPTRRNSSALFNTMATTSTPSPCRNSTQPQDATGPPPSIPTAAPASQIVNATAVPTEVPGFVADAGGNVVKINPGSTVRPADNGNGVVYQPQTAPGAHPNADQGARRPSAYRFYNGPRSNRAADQPGDWKTGHKAQYAHADYSEKARRSTVMVKL